MKRPSVVVEGDYQALSIRAAALIDAAVRARPEIVMALPTGTTPVATYSHLIRMHQETGTDWSRVTTFNLDEYVGLGADHPESYARFMELHLFHGINLAVERRHLPDGPVADPAAEAQRYESLIDTAGGIDLAVLGVGTNGHLGFNEPGDTLTAATHVTTLADETWQRNFGHLPSLVRSSGDPASRPFNRAYTMGIGTILQARRIILLATGAHKRGVLQAALNGPLTTRNPASLLQLHADVTLLVDQAAAPL